MATKKTKKGVIIIIALLVLVIVVIFSIRMFSQEDDWICKNGVWTKHGQPSATKPDSPCQ
ncbi:MAG: hypothetical protein PHN59_07110 [Candidatus Omnitrophica bacterium]|nr:hypothetical protein [Candidatus Omnitrophota bacterium]